MRSADCDAVEETKKGMFLSPFCEKNEHPLALSQHEVRQAFQPDTCRRLSAISKSGWKAWRTVRMHTGQRHERHEPLLEQVCTGAWQSHSWLENCSGTRWQTWT